MRRRGLKSEVLVELPGLLVKGMHEKGSDAGVLRYGHGAIDRILEQGTAQVKSLRPAIHREPGENHDWNRIRHIASHAARCKLVRNSACGHGVVTADMPALVGDNEGAARTAGLVGQCPALEPVIENGLAALEIIESMRSRQGLRRTELQTQTFVDFLPQGALTAMRRSSPGLRAGGASSSLVNCRNFSASNLKNT
jgi:hypothetical protein